MMPVTDACDINFIPKLYSQGPEQAVALSTSTVKPIHAIHAFFPDVLAQKRTKCPEMAEI